MPEVSVVMSVYNSERYLNEAIESILAQSYREFEFIIINDGSNIETVEILNHFGCRDNRIRLIHQKNHGLAYSLNRGIKEAKGKFIARMDSDDISDKNRISEQYRIITKDEDIVAIGTNAEVIDETGEFIYQTNQPITWEEVKKKLPATPFIHPSVLFRRNEALRIGGYPNVPISQDVFFFNKLAQMGKLINIDESLFKYRIQPNALSRKGPDTIKIVDKLLKRYLDDGQLDNYLIEILETNIKKDKDLKEYYYNLHKGILLLKYTQNRKEARKYIQRSFIHKITFISAITYILTFFKSSQRFYKKIKLVINKLR